MRPGSIWRYVLRMFWSPRRHVGQDLDAYRARVNAEYKRDSTDEWIERSRKRLTRGQRPHEQSDQRTNHRETGDDLT